MVEDIKKLEVNKPHPHQKPHHHEEIKKPASLPKKKINLRKIKIVLLIFVLIIVLLSILGVITYFLIKPVITSGQKTMNTAKDVYEAGKKQDLVLALEKIQKTEEELKDTQKKYQKLQYLKLVPFVSAYYHDGLHGLKAGLFGIEAGEILIEAITPYADVLGFKGQGSFMGGTAEDRIVKMVQTLDKVIPQIDEVVSKLEDMEAEIAEINAKRYPKEFKGVKIQDNLNQVKKSLKETMSEINEAKPMIDVLPKILGYPDKKNYLIIFQNDGELRATGGFMTAYSVLEFDSGKIKAGKSDDIYSLDKKLKSRLKPPEAIKEYLFSNEFGTGLVPYFYLRDMNFSPDFKVSMDTFKENYDKISSETKVQGIIGVDTYVLKDILDVVGEIDVPGYGKFNTQPDKRCHGIPNIICELEYLVDQPLPTESGNRKQTILGPMMQVIMLKALGSPKQQWPQLFSTGLNLLKEKHILLYFTDEKIQHASEAFNSAGRIREFAGDYLHVNDNNFGGAKSNLFTKHNVEQEVEISDTGRITKTLTLIYENKETMDNCNLERKSGLCLNSILRNYFRIYVPKGAKLLEGLGSETEIKSAEDLGKTYFEGFMTVRGEGGRAKVVVKYELPFTLKEGEAYKLLIQKQPGTLGHQYKLTFGDHEEEWELKTDREFNF